MFGQEKYVHISRYVTTDGESFYGVCIIPYLESALQRKIFGATIFEVVLHPTPEGLQNRLMQFKTNYPNLEVVEKKTTFLHGLIDDFRR